MIADQARLWGFKAGRAGLSASENPYRGEMARVAWLIGRAAGAEAETEVRIAQRHTRCRTYEVSGHRGG